MMPRRLYRRIDNPYCKKAEVSKPWSKVMWRPFSLKSYLFTILTGLVLLTESGDLIMICYTPDCL